MDTSSLALARSRAYLVLARLVIEGLTPASLPVVRALPALASAFDASADPDVWAAEHHRVLGRGVSPYRGVFCDSAGQLGGPSADLSRRAYEACGFGARRTDLEPDHVGMHLHALAFVCQAEAEALEDGRPEVEIASLREHQQRLLSGLLLPWLAPLVLAVRAQASPLYTAVVELCAELALSHASEASVAAATMPVAQIGWSARLDEPRTGLKDIAAELLRPALSGWFLGIADLHRLGTSLRLPHGFGARLQILESLWFTAIDHGEWPALLDALEALRQQWIRGYTELEGLPVGGWLSRLEETGQVIARLRTAEVARGDSLPTKTRQQPGVVDESR